MARVLRDVGLRHHAAEGLAEHDRLLDAERRAKRAHVIAPLLQSPRRRIARHAASVAAVVDVDHLRDVGEAVEVRPETGMVEAWPAMHDDESRLLTHHRAVKSELRPDDVEEDLLIAE